MTAQNVKRGDSQGRKLPWNPRVSIFLACVALAGAFWLMHALSKQYTTRVVLPVEFTNLPAGRLMPGNLPDSISADVRASGFALLVLLWADENESVKLDLSRARSVGGGEYAIATNSSQHALGSRMGNSIKVVKLFPDTIVLGFEGKLEKKVPVYVRATLNCAPMYKLGDSIVVTPRYVTISGPEALLAKISFIETATKEFNDVSENILEDIDLVMPEGITQVSVQPSVVKISAVVGKYTEGRFTIPLNTINVPGNLDLKTFPDKVDVIFQVPVENYSVIKPEMFRAVADYRKVQKGSQSLEVEIVKQPASIRNLKIEPNRVDFIIRK